MKNIFKMLFAGFIFFSCGNENTGKMETSETKNSQTAQPPVTEETSSSRSSGDGLVGEWKLVLEAYDDNNNDKLDEEERKKGWDNNYYYRFNPDGTAKINGNDQARGAMSGRYETKTVNNKQMLYVYIDDPEEKGPVGHHIILSLDKNELVTMDEAGDYVFWVFKRI